MRWDNLTGLEPESEQEKRTLRRQTRLFMSSFGRVAVVMLLSFTIIATADSWAVSADSELEWSVFGLQTLAFAWSISPMLRAAYNLVQMHRGAYEGPWRDQWEIENNG